MSSSKATTRRRAGSGGLACLVVGVAVFAAVATAIGSGITRKSFTHFAVFSHRGLVAYAADANGMAPPGSILASSNGQTNVYVWHGVPAGATEEEVCVLDEQAGGGMAAGCDSPAVAEARGISVIHMPAVEAGATSVAVLVPNGVGQVSFTDSEGVTHTSAVTDNVAAVEDQSASKITVRYTLRDGTTKSTTLGP
jgi:hypothetical protein